MSGIAGIYYFNKQDSKSLEHELIPMFKTMSFGQIDDQATFINAKYFADQGAIKMISQSGLSDKDLCNAIDNILLDVKEQAKLIVNTKLLIKSNANELLAVEILKFNENL